jgi:hypothetical protein
MALESDTHHVLQPSTRIRMISRPTVLILGAGSSAHAGYPLGRELVAQLCALRRQPSIDGLPANWEADRVRAFLQRLSYSDPGSIDAFLEANRTDGDLGKFLIAQQLKKSEDMDRLFPPSDAGWYRYAFDRLLIKGKPDFASSQLAIITFNYDRSLEAYFLTRLQTQFRLSEKEATEILRSLSIVHVHGILGEYPAFPYRASTNPEELIALSRQIQIIHELTDTDDGFCNDQFRMANELLRHSERIYFLGFGFHRDNLRRLRFFTSESVTGREVKGTASGIGAIGLGELTASLEEFGMHRAIFDGNICNNFFSHAVSL